MQKDNWLMKNWVTIVGFAIQLIILGVFIGRSEQILSNHDTRIINLEQRVTEHHEDTNLHTNGEWRNSVISKLDRLDGKIDAHMMKDVK